MAPDMNTLVSPLISVIVAVYNGKATLQQCIDSFAEQTYLNKELIVIDGESQDGTVELLNANQEKFAYWISEPDHGIFNAWNKGLAQAKGEWICFLGADDYFWDATVLERMARKLEELPSNIRVAYGKVMRLSAEGKEIRLDGKPWSEIKENIIENLCIPHTGTMQRRSLFERHGNFDETFRIAGDSELLMRELKAGDAVHFPDIVTAGVRAGGISTDPKYTITALRELRRAQRKHGIFLPGRSWLKQMVRQYVRVLLRSLLGDRLARKLRERRFATVLKKYIPEVWRWRILSWRSKGCTKGQSVYLHPSVQMLGAANITVGNNTCIGEHTWLNVNHRIENEVAISIGDNCFIGRRNFFSSGKKIEIGHYVLTTVDCKFICSSHIVDNPLIPYVAAGTTSDGIISIGANCFIGVGTLVLGNVVIGHGSVIGAGSLVIKNIPPFSMAVGNPARILRQYSFKKKAWIDMDKISEDDLVENPNESQYVDMLRHDWPKISMPIIAAGSDLGNL